MIRIVLLWTLASTLNILSTIKCNCRHVSPLHWQSLRSPLPPPRLTTTTTAAAATWNPSPAPIAAALNYTKISSPNNVPFCLFLSFCHLTNLAHTFCCCSILCVVISIQGIDVISTRALLAFWFKTQSAPLLITHGLLSTDILYSFQFFYAPLNMQQSVSLLRQLVVIFFLLLHWGKH